MMKSQAELKAEEKRRRKNEKRAAGSVSQMIGELTLEELSDLLIDGILEQKIND